MTGGQASFSQFGSRHPQLLDRFSRLGPAVACCALSTCSTTPKLACSCPCHDWLACLLAYPMLFLLSLPPASFQPWQTNTNFALLCKFHMFMHCNTAKPLLTECREGASGSVQVSTSRGDPMKCTEAQADVCGTTFHVRGIRSRADTPAATCWPGSLEVA